MLATAVDLHRQGHLAQAETLYRTILSVDPRHADALHFLGVAAHQRGDHTAAASLIAQAIGVNRKAPQYHFNHGVALQAMQQHTAAAQSYRRAVQLQPQHAAAWENLGVALQDSGDMDSARAAYVKALSVDDRSPLALLNLGTLLLNVGQAREARERFQALLSMQPAHAEARMKYAIALLAEGNFADGWTEYEWRHHSRSAHEHQRPRLVPFAKWEGSSLRDKTLLIHPEQGIGEELMFASCYAQAIEQCAHCVIESDPRLVALFARSFPTATVIAGDRASDFSWNASLPPIDYRCPAGSLPRLFRRSAAEFPEHDGYLRVDEARRTHWRQILATLDRPLNVGISWSGGKDARAAKARSIPLAHWTPLFRALDVNFINLQYGQHQSEIDDFHQQRCGTLHTLAVDPVKDPDDTMALIAALDLVITIDNSTAFMAGAVGTPLCVLLPSNAEWRWGGTQGRSPWYPRALLFQQSKPAADAWPALLERVATTLPEHLRATPAQRIEASNSATSNGAPTTISTRADSALLVNDTRSWYHWGCSATSLAIHTRLRRRWRRIDSLPIQRIVSLEERPTSLTEFDDDDRFSRFSAANADVITQMRNVGQVYVNGEGTLHGTSPQAVGLLYLAYIAKRRFGLPVHIVNHSCYPDDTIEVKDSPQYELYRTVYRAMDFIAIREPVSARVLGDLGIDVTETFDCLPLFVREHGVALDSQSSRTPATIVIAGSVAWGATSIAAALGALIVSLHGAGLRPVVLIGADAHLAADDVQFVTTLQRTAGGCFQLYNATSELEWLRVIASAGLLLSGRFHHSIAAAFLGTPFVLMESNTPKIAGLMQRLESQSFVSAAQPNLAATLYERVRSTLASPDSARVSPQVLERLIALAERNFQ